MDHQIPIGVQQVANGGGSSVGDRREGRREAQHHELLCSFDSTNPFVTRLQHPYATAKSMAAARRTRVTFPSVHVHPLLQSRSPEFIQSQHAKLKGSSHEQQQIGGTSSSSFSKKSQWHEVLILEQYLTSAVQYMHTLRRRFVKMGIFDLPIWSLLLPCLVLACFILVTSRHDSWTPLPHRQLKGRTCVMNMFIDKKKPNEFNPDFQRKLIPKTSTAAAAAAKTEDTTYRSRGQLEIISRLIGCVADNFRHNIKLEQVIVFANVRDGGHLAQEALLYWPQRGNYATQLHIIASQNERDSYDYSVLNDLEDRFRDSTGGNIHLYDWDLNTVSIMEQAGKDDDDAAGEVVTRNRNRRPSFATDYLQPASLRTLLIPDADEPTIIPYFHLDGYWKEQYLLLLRAKPLLEDKTIVVVGMEHAPDLNILEMVAFYSELNYKIFMLGLRQLARIDNLCPEVLENLLQHPSILLHDDGNMPLYHPSNSVVLTPPFFVAMPKGRHAMEEMAIQHMYDLFSGEEGGGQVKTANDRKTPPKK